MDFSRLRSQRPLERNFATTSFATSFSCRGLLPVNILLFWLLSGEKVNFWVLRKILRLINILVSTISARWFMFRESFLVSSKWQACSQNLSLYFWFLF